jgi:predicted transcriptional regulator
MNLKEHLHTLGLQDKELARNAGLSVSTVKMVGAGRPVTKFTVDRVLDVLSQKYGRKVEREEVEGLLLADETQT